MRNIIALRRNDVVDNINFLEGILNNSEVPRISELLENKRGAVDRLLEQLKDKEAHYQNLHKDDKFNKEFNRKVKKAGLK